MIIDDDDDSWELISHMKQIIYMWKLDHVLINMIHMSRGPARDLLSE